MTGGKRTTSGDSAASARPAKASNRCRTSSKIAPRQYSPATPWSISSLWSSSAGRRVSSSATLGRLRREEERRVGGVDAVVADHERRGQRVTHVAADGERRVVLVAGHAADPERPVADVEHALRGRDLEVLD